MFLIAQGSGPNTPIIAAAITGFCMLLAVVLGKLLPSEWLSEKARWRRKLQRGFIILVNGGSGVGKTTVAWALARRYNVPTILGTDLVRETLRYELVQGFGNIDKTVMASSFLAYEVMPDDLPKVDNASDIVRAYSDQSLQVAGPICRIINRIRTKRDPTIIEGVNLIAAQIFAQLPTDPYAKILFVNLHIDDKAVHVARLRERGEKAHEPPELTDKYITHIDEIEEIDRFLKTDAHARMTVQENVVSIENSGTLRHAIAQIDQKVQFLLKKHVIGHIGSRHEP